MQRTQTDTLRNGIYTFKYVNPGTYTVEVTEPSHFTQTATVTVEANASTYQNFYLKRVRDTPPVVVDYSPVWSEGDPAVKCSTPIILSFNWDMDSATTCDAFTLDPPLEGNFKWEDSYYRLIFTPADAFDVNTLYTLTLKQTAEHGGGTPMEEDFTMQFYTQPRNHLEELAVFPYEGAPVHYTKPTVELRVDSLLDTYNLFQRLRVLDSEGNELAWNRRSIKYNKKGDDYGYVRIPLVKDIEPGKDYHLILDMDIADTAGIHLPAARDIVFQGVDAGADKPGAEVVDEFENADDYYSYSSDEADEPSSSELTNSTERLFGSKSMQVTYELSDDNGAIFIRPKDTLSTSFYKGDTLGIHIWGDMSYNSLMAHFSCDDENSDGFTSFGIVLGPINFHGWRYVEIVPKTSNAYGNKVKFNGISIAPSGHPWHPLVKTGTVRFDNLLRKAASSGIDEVSIAGLKVKCEGDYIVASADTWIQGLELLDIQGRTVKTTGGNCLNISDMTAGVYLVRVHINDRTSTCKVRL